MNRRVLFLEDDLLMGALITQMLGERGVEVSFINRLELLKDAIRDTCPDALLLDLEIGNRSALEELPAVHLEFPSLPILIASSHHDSKEMASCYEAGALYYLVKPYEVDELMRILQLALPSNGQAEVDTIRFGQSRLHLIHHTLQCACEDRISLNPKEFQLLKLLLTSKNELVPRERILLEIWDNADASNSLNNYINKLRGYLKADTSLSLDTRKGRGYILHVR